MTEEIVFYHNPQSRSQMAHWMLEEAAAPYRIVPIDFAKGEHKTPSFLAINPMGKLPTIVHRGTVVTETAAIIAYIADAFPQAGLAPPPAERDAYYRWLFFVAGCCEPAMGNKANGWNPDTPELKVRFGYGSYEQVIDTVTKAIDGKRYIAADRFTAADLYMASFLHWGMMFGVIEKRPVFETYVKPHIERPAAKRAEEKAAKLVAKA